MALKPIGWLCRAAALAALVTVAPASAQLVVTSYGGAYQEAQRKAYFEPFTKATGIKIIEATGPDPAKIKAMVQAGNVEWDVVDLSHATLMVLAEQDLLTAVDYGQFDAATRRAIPAELMPRYGVGNETWSVVMAWRSDRLKQGPQSWAEFWDTTKFPGKRAFFDSSFTAPIIELALLADGVAPDKIYPVDMERGFKSLSRLRPHVIKWTGSSSGMQQMLTDGEADLVIIANGRIEALQQGKVPHGFSFGQQMILSSYWAVPKGSKHTAEAMRFLAFASQAEHQANFAKLAPWGPVNRDAFKFIPPERAAQLPTAPQNMKTAFLSKGEWWAQKDSSGRTNLERYVRAWNSWWLSGR